MPPPKREPTKIADVIDQWFALKNYRQKWVNFEAYHHWQAIVGPEIAKNTAPTKFHKDTLVIKVRNSVWMQELQYLKPKILEKIKEALPETTIKDLLFKVGEIGGE